MGLTCSDARCRLHPGSLACCPRRSLVSQASRLTMVGSNSRRADELQGHLPAQQHCCRAATKFLFGGSTPSPHSRRQGFLLPPLPFRRGSLHRSAAHTSTACSRASSLLDRAPDDSAAGVFRQLPSRPRGIPTPSLVRKLDVGHFSCRSCGGAQILQSRRSGDDDGSSPPPSCKRLLRCGLSEPGVDCAS
ncbi:hypothetical protein HPB50_022748 [Hyalomma asiaticum]|uniref:Uncharacterized protein n=1 Tax=Hyalomma asiaticum TaxID=266040 RepID=A0ACB7RQQ8_HYAAI|nr:hypothetical protein HPB50_022748 [Hyalomma asiaticum]